MLDFRGWRILAVVLLVAPMLAACANNSTGVKRGAFTEREFGVKASPRVTKAKYPQRGGGRQLPAKPYVVRGVTYTPVDGPGYAEVGQASWYGQDFHGRRTANGEIFGAYYLTAASPVLPIPSYARVTNLENGRSVLVRVNDRGPYLQGRVADVSYETARVLGFIDQGHARIEIKYVAPAPLNGDDSRMLVASINQPSRLEGQGDIRVAMADAPGTAPAGRDPFSGGLVGDIIGLFGYAGTDKTVSDAVEAASAMAGRTPALDDWKNAVHEDARTIRLDLGVYVEVKAIEIAEAFAALGAVDEDSAVDAAGGTATRLTLTKLKPGVAREDVLALAQQLGLDGLVLY